MWFLRYAYGLTDRLTHRQTIIHNIVHTYESKIMMTIMISIIFTVTFHHKLSAAYIAVKLTTKNSVNWNMIISA